MHSIRAAYTNPYKNSTLRATNNCAMLGMKRRPWVYRIYLEWAVMSYVIQTACLKTRMHRIRAAYTNPYKNSTRRAAYIMDE